MSAGTVDLVPDWIVGFYYGNQFITSVAVETDGKGDTYFIPGPTGLMTDVSPELHRHLVRMAIHDFEETFKYQPSVTQVRDAVAQLHGHRQLVAQISGDIDPFDDEATSV